MTIETMPEAPVLEPTTPIKPSEALRLGRLLYPVRNQDGLWFGHDRGRYWPTDREAVTAVPDGSACAMGAIHAGWGGRPFDREGERRTNDRVAALVGSSVEVWGRFDTAEHLGRNGDAAVLRFLEERGL